MDTSILRKELSQILRIPTAAKFINNRPLNFLGLQPVRQVTARGLQALRRAKNRNDYAETLLLEGVVVIENFLEEESFEALLKECERNVEKRKAHSILQHGRNQLRIWNAQQLSGNAAPLLRAFLGNRTILNTVSAVEGREIFPTQGHRAIEELLQVEGDSEDQETELHVDTFFNTHKSWLYLTDVNESNGPLVYVPKTHNLSFTRLRKDYLETVNLHSSGAGRGSRRVRAEESRKYAPEKIFTVRKNTLVIANTSGFHRRLPGRPGCRRLAIHQSYRANPFLGSGPKTEKIETWIRNILGT